MRTGKTVTRWMLASGFALALVAGAGCESDQSTASVTPNERPGPRYDMVADASLGAGDGLGGQLFSEREDQPSVAVFRVAENAIAVAEAKAADGTYDQWYAHFIRPGESDTAIAEADEPSEQEAEGEPGPDTFVDVPVPTDGQQ